MISTVRPVPTPGTSTTEGTTTGEQEGLPLVGRSELLDRAVNLVLVGGNVLLFGADGCGRTAVLHEVVHRLATEERATVLIDGSGVDEPRRLVGLIVRACGLTVPADLDVPSMLGCLPAPAAAQRVIAIDDLEVSAGQELFGQVAPPPLAPWGPVGGGRWRRRSDAVPGRRSRRLVGGRDSARSRTRCSGGARARDPPPQGCRS